MITHVADKFGIAATTLTRWRQEFGLENQVEPSGQGIKTMTDEERQIARLKMQLREAELERDNRRYKQMENVERRDDRLDGLFHRSFETSRGTYGSPLIWHDLARQGIRVFRATVGRRIRRKGLSPKRKKR